jgi:CheY-like chemotaxis protein
VNKKEISVLIVEANHVAENLQQPLIEDGYEAVGRPTEQRPDVVVIDIGLKSARDGIEMAEHKRHRRRGRILIVDDEEMVLRTLQRALEDHSVVCAQNVQEAIIQIEHQTFDLIISDLMMPGLTGRDFYEHVLQRVPKLARRMVFVTGGGNLNSKHTSFLRSISNRVLEKPFEIHLLRELVEFMLAEDH